MEVEQQIGWWTGTEIAVDTNSFDSSVFWAKENISRRPRLKSPNLALTWDRLYAGGLQSFKFICRQHWTQVWDLFLQMPQGFCDNYWKPLIVQMVWPPQSPDLNFIQPICLNSNNWELQSTEELWNRLQNACSNLLAKLPRYFKKNDP